MTISGVGIDIVEIDRFRAVVEEKKDGFLENTFTKIERDYCSRYRDTATHFAGTFAAKEAVQKTLEKRLSMQQIEIRRLKNGKPEVWLRGRRSKSLLISISHEKSVACAVAFHR